MANKKNEVTVTFSNKTIIRIVLFVAVGFLILGFFAEISYALELIFISCFLALAMNPAVSYLTKRLKLKSRSAATAIAYLIVLLLLSGFLVVIVPPIISQTVDVIKEIPTSLDDIKDQSNPIVNFIERNNLTNTYTEIMTSVKSNLQGIATRAVDVATAIGGAAVAVITVLVMTFMMLVEGPKWSDTLLKYQTRPNELKLRKTLSKMYRLVTGYVNGQILIATIAATFALVALLIVSSVLNVSINALALAGVVGLIGLIPMIGNTLAAVIVVLTCAFVSVPLAIIMAVFFLVYQQVENATLQPFIQAKYNELTPLTVFVAALIGVSVAGFFGALVAIPIAGCIRIYFIDYHSERLLKKSN